jgi:hypothetical protein
MQNFVDFEEDVVFGKMSPSKFFVFFDHQNALLRLKTNSSGSEAHTLPNDVKQKKKLLL